MTNILVAEDNASLRRLMGIHLRRAGYRVTEAADGLDALEDKLTGFHAGADDYLTKPVDFEELLLRVEALFARDDMK